MDDAREMTREEAINIMRVIIHMLEEKYDTDRVEDAVEMAIKALEQEPCEDAVSRAEVLNLVRYNAFHVKSQIKAIENLPPVTPQEPCEDVISRQAVLDCAVMAQIKGANEDGYITRNIILVDEVKTLPSVNPTYTDEEIDKAQAVEQAYIDKMVELSVNDKLDKIRAEIYEEFMTIDGGVHDESAKKCMQIIDKYTADVEPQEGEG